MTTPVDVSPVPRARPSLDRCLAPFLHLLLAFAALWPAWTATTTRMVGHPDGDVWNHAWGPWWFWESLTAGALPWRTELLLAPKGGTLWFIDPIGGLLAAPLVPLLGLEGAWNLMLLLHLAVASAGIGRLAAELSERGPHVYVASAALLFGPYLLSEVHNGISEAVNVGPALFALAATARAHRLGRLRHWALVGLCLGWAALGSAYYALSAGLLSAAWSLPKLLRAPRQIPGALVGAAIAGALTAPIGALMRRSVNVDDALIHRASEQVAGLLLHNAVDPRTFLWPFGFQSVDLAAQGEPFLHSGYLGFSVLVAAGIGLWRTRQYALAAAALVVMGLALGPWLFFDGAWVTLENGSRLALPYKALEAALPPQALTHSLRLGMTGIAAVAALAAAGLAGRHPAWISGAMGVVILEMVLLGGTPWPPERTEPLPTSAAEFIATQEIGDRAVVFDLPGAVGDTMATSRYLALQTVHGRPLPYRPDARGATSSLNACATALPLLLASEHRPEHRRMLEGPVQKVTALDAAELALYGVDWIAVHRDLERGAERIEATEVLLQRLLGDPKVFGPVALYRVANQGEVALTEADKAMLRE